MAERFSGFRSIYAKSCFGNFTLGGLGDSVFAGILFRAYITACLQPLQPGCQCLPEAAFLFLKGPCVEVCTSTFRQQSKWDKACMLLEKFVFRATGTIQERSVRHPRLWR